jgi:hypothetical protein
MPTAPEKSTKYFSLVFLKFEPVLHMVLSKTQAYKQTKYIGFYMA